MEGRAADPGSDPATRALLGLAFLFTLLSRLQNFFSPFGYGFDGWLGAMHGSAARHFARSGIVEMRLLPFITSGPALPGDPGAQFHHPPLLHVLNGWVFRAADALTAGGGGDWTLRVVPTLATLGTIALVFAIGRRLAGARAGALAAAVFAALPMIVDYGGLANYEPVVLLGTAGCYLLHLRFLESGRARDAALVGAALTATILVDWFGAFVAIPIALEAVLLSRKRLLDRRAALGYVLFLGVASVAVVAAVLAWYEHAQPGALAALREHAAVRTGSAAGDGAGLAGTFTGAQWTARIAGNTVRLFTGPTLALAAAGLLLAALAGGALRGAAARALALGLVGLCAVATFPQASYTHEFLSYAWALPAALGAALLPEALAALAPARAGSACGWRGSGRGFPSPGNVRIGAMALVLGAAVLGARDGHRLLATWHNDSAYRTLGRTLAAVTERTGAVATPGTDGNVWDVAGFYADRRAERGFTTLEAILAAHRRPSRPGGCPPVRYVAFTAPLVLQHRELVHALAERCASRGDERLFVFDLGPGS